MNHAQKRTLLAVAVVTLLTAACAKKVAVGPPPPPAPGPAPAVASKPAPPPPVHAAAAERPAATTPAPKYPNAVTRARIDTLLAKIEDALQCRPGRPACWRRQRLSGRDRYPAQLSLISYGKERPVCQEEDEACWQRNRRIHIVATAQAQK
jgi:peptidoglycan-associated lipoprotein